MRIDNGLATNINRQMKNLRSRETNVVEKLSSGLRINRAADCAAGLSISEKMRAQIRGLVQVSRNAQDGISVVQTAEGAMDEIHKILQRMRQLAVQSANDSNTSANERVAMQQEVDQLTDELDRISSTTQFNTMNLLDGTFKNKYFHIGSNIDQDLGIDIESMDIVGLGLHSGTWQRIEDPQKKASLKVQATLATDVSEVKGSQDSKQHVELVIGNSTSKFEFEVGTTAQEIVDTINMRIKDKGKAVLNGNVMQIDLSVGVNDRVYLLKIDNDTHGGIAKNFVSANAVDNNNKGEPPKPAELVISGVSTIGGTGTQEITVNIDGKDYGVSLNSGDDINAIAGKIQTAIGGAGTAVVDNGNIVIKSTSQGENSSISITREEINKTTGGIADGAVATVTPGTVGIPAVPGEQAVVTVPNVTNVGPDGYQEIDITITRLARDRVTTELKTFSDIKLTADMTTNQIVSTINKEISGWSRAEIDTSGNITIKLLKQMHSQV